MTSKKFLIPEHKKDHDKKPWLVLCLLSLLFYGAMLLLSLTARDIHNARLPQVTASRPFKQKFTYTVTWEDSVIERTGSFTALPKDMVDTGKVFTLRSETENDFTYHYAQQISIVVDEGKTNDDYYAITSGINSWDTLIVTGYEALEDGDEVFLIQENKENQKNNPSTEDLFQ